MNSINYHKQKYHNHYIIVYGLIGLTLESERVTNIKYIIEREVEVRGRIEIEIEVGIGIEIEIGIGIGIEIEVIRG